MGAVWGAKRALRTHRRNCPICQAASGYEELCPEFRSAMSGLAALGFERKMLRDLERMEPRIPEQVQPTFRRDLEDSRADLRRTEEQIRAFVQRTKKRTSPPT
jgi:hypothetical protein